jgi:NADH-quinone oxidoreductase subunit L
MSLTILALIPLFPLVAAAVTSFMQNVKQAAGIAIAALLGSCGIALLAFSETWGGGIALETYSANWLTIGDTEINFGFVLNPLTVAMAAMVTFVGSLIFIYSAGYMAHDKRMARFFCYLSLFASGMLGVVIANSLILFFMCWEIVGVASYLLISFWNHKPEAAAAGKKAFIVTRIGDMGFLIGILLAFKTTGTLDFYTPEKNGILEVLPTGSAFGVKATAAISFLLFIGAVGKSGQLPLHVWLPDAMEGPTPVSALIHAATMVAAGVFLVARTFPLFEDGGMLDLVAWVGAITALAAAFIALGQYDLKRILAYSTVSQLGLMMVGIGVAGVSVGMFHLLTHAFFKALLFLGAGSIIHGCHEEQDIRKMGGLAKPMPLTTIAYLCGTLALVAFPFTSGFLSKEEILFAAWETDKQPIFWVTALASLMTAVYMTRQCMYVFPGTHRGEHAPHESPRIMTVPLLILSVFALGLGALAKSTLLETLPGPPAADHKSIVIAVSIAAALGGIALGFLIYRERALGQAADPLALKPFERKFWFDEFYEATVGKVWTLFIITGEQLNELLVFIRDLAVELASRIGTVFAISGDRKLIDSLAFDGLCGLLRYAGRTVTRPQNGFLPGYLRLIALGAVLLGALVLWTK